MLTLRSILCPVDFSEQSQHALQWAAALAARHKSRLTVLTAVDPLLAEAAKARLGLDLANTETQPALREFVEAVVPEGASWAPQTSIDVRVGDAADVILETADREHADLIALGTHGLGGFRKLLLGSTTERVLRRTKTALLAVPFKDARSIVLETSGPRLEPKRIVMATDFSEASTAAFRWAADLAQQMAAPLVLAHVVTPLAVSARWRSYVEQVDEDRAREARGRLEALSGDLSRRIACEAVVSTGSPADSIATIAEERQAGLIVLGLMGHQGIRGPRPGSIAVRVLCLAHVPVLVVPPQGFVESVPSR